MFVGAYGSTHFFVTVYFFRICSIIKKGGIGCMKRKEDLPECPIATTVSLVGSKWKLLIIRNLMKRPWRFNELQKSLDGISQKVLTESLRQLTEDGLVYRKDYKTNPPKVEYGMTELGKKFLNVLKSMENFGNYYKSL